MKLKAADIQCKISSNGKRTSGLKTPSGLRNKNSGYSPSPSPTNLSSSSHTSITKVKDIKNNNIQSDVSSVTVKVPTLRV